MRKSRERERERHETEPRVRQKTLKQHKVLKEQMNMGGEEGSA